MERGRELNFIDWPFHWKSGLFWTAALLLTLKILQWMVPAHWATFAPLLLIYLPFFLFMRMRRPIDFLDRDLKTFWRNVILFLLAVLIIFPPYLLVAHVWMLYVFGYHHFNPASWIELFRFGLYQTLVVALPEEFFFRGYLHPILNRAWPQRWNFWGTKLGWGWVFTALLFAFAHSVIYIRWWHFSIFFPALLFGYLRERSGSITAPILFHAFSNCFMNWFMQSYLR